MGARAEPSSSAGAVLCFPEELAERVLRSHPVPIADALQALLAAESAFEERDRIVELFRAQLRLLAALVMAARVQYGPGPAGEAKQVPGLMRSLRARGLTDGQWVALLRETLRPWAKAADAHPLPLLVTLVHKKRSELLKLWDELLVMRKSETVAHGATGTREALEGILRKRTPQLARTLELLDPIWSEMRLVMARGEGVPAAAMLLMGVTPHGGRFRRVRIDTSEGVAPDEALLVDEEGKPRLALHPVVLVRKPALDLPEELFVLDGSHRRGALYVAFPSMAEHRVAAAWDSLDDIMDDEAPPPESEREGARPSRPYRGLASFGAEDADLFFGREEQAEGLANRIRRSGLVTVTGPSGSGKTSLLRAGVLPLLRDARAAYVRPGAHPVASLAARLGEALDLDPAELTTLIAEPLGLRARIAQATAGDLLVVVIDQAEEMLTLSADAAERETFARALVALGTGDGVTRVVISVREDFFARLATVKALFGVFSRHVEVVTTPDDESLAHMLLGPAKAFGYAFEDTELIESIVKAVSGTGAALALLSFAADRLWEARDRKWKRLTSAAYGAIGGALGALASHATGELDKLSPSERRACRTLFLRLVTAERTRAVVPVDELLEASRDAGETERVLERMIGARLLVATEDASGAGTVEIVHEALVRHWDVLDRWLSEDEEGQRLRHALRQAAKEWDGRGRPRGLLWGGEQQLELARFARKATDPLTGLEHAFAEACRDEAARQKRLRAGLVIGAFVALAVFAVFMFLEWRSAERARREVVQQQEVTAQEKLRAEIRGIVAEARGREGRGLVDDAHALLRAAVALEGELEAKGTTHEMRDLERLDRGGAGTLSLVGPKGHLMLAAASKAHQRVFLAGTDDDVFVFDTAQTTVAARLPHPGVIVRAMAVSPDERWLVTACADNRDRRGVLRVYALPSLELRKEVKAPNKGFRQVAFNGDGTALVARSRGDAPLLVALPSMTTRSLALEGAIEDIAAGKRLFAATTATTTTIFEADGSPVTTLPEADAKVRALAFSQADAAVVRGTEAGTVERFDPRAPDEPVTKSYRKQRIGALHFAGDKLVVATLEGKLHVEAPGQRTRTHLAGSGRPHYALGSAHYAVLTESDQEVRVFDLATGALRLKRRGHDGEIVALAWLGDRLLTAGWDRKARLWPARPYPVRRSLPLETGMKRFAVTPDGTRLAVAQGAGKGASKLQVLSTRGDTLLSTRLEGSVRAVLLDAAGARAVAVAEDRVMAIDVATSKPLATMPVSGAKLLTAAANAELSRLAVGDDAGRLHLFAGLGAKARIVPSAKKALLAVTASPSAHVIAAAGTDHVMRLHRFADGAEVLALETKGFPKAAFSADGKRVAIGDLKKVVLVDITADGAATKGREVDVGGSAVSALAFSPDGKTLMVARSRVGKEALWRVDVGSGAITKLPLDHIALDMAFSPDGSRLLVGDNGGGASILTGGAVPAARVPVATSSVQPVRFIGDGGEALAVPFHGGAAVIATARRDRDALLQSTGAATNLRVCRETLDVVAVPSSSADAVFAPAEACAR